MDNTPVIKKDVVVQAPSVQPVVSGKIPAQLQQRFRRVGFVRFGYSTPYEAQDKQGNKITRYKPVKSEYAVFSSNDDELLKRMSAIYGGKVEPNANPNTLFAYRLITKSKVIPVRLSVVPLRLCYEAYKGRKCIRRCDGETEEKSGGKCVCPVTDPAAMQGKDCCKISMTLQLFVDGCDTFGVWAFKTASYHAASEIPLSIAVAQQLAAHGRLVQCHLAAPLRKGIDESGQAIVYPVPEVRIDATISDLYAMLENARGGNAQLGSSAPTPTPSLPASDHDTIEAEAYMHDVDPETGEVATSSTPDEVFNGYCNAYELDPAAVSLALEEIGVDRDDWVLSAINNNKTGAEFMTAIKMQKLRMDAESASSRAKSTKPPTTKSQTPVKPPAAAQSDEDIAAQLLGEEDE